MYNISAKTLYNRETVAAIREAEHILADPQVKKYSDVEEALLELKRYRLDKQI